ncbi:tetratricopeptide repeat protein [Pseudomonas sp. B21-053]|uniref:tetratricopeptide repeat protein n=1 Tax=Pseudomonas sp. B21-053 TaxID=2895493 RepID=UPI00222FE3CE|nr:hypothetical protein [Pseudomonas sp. B21-053]UZE11871.1 hypothetical protein LOY68_31210 [Pseudomonas sp. B21-053]
MLVVFLVLTAGHVWADAGNLNCDPDSNVCTVVTIDNYCDVGEVAKTKWDMHSDQYVLSCECDCTSQENTFWLVSKPDDFSVALVDASKVLSPTEVEKNKAGVSDIFGLVPYCSISSEPQEALVRLRKIPSPANAPQPYCYLVDESVRPGSCNTADCKTKKELVQRLDLSIKTEALIEFKNATARLYLDEKRFRSFPKRSFVERHIKLNGYSKADQQFYNDIAYYWQQAGFNDDAIWLLEILIANNPERTVAYLNLADAYWGRNEKRIASGHYKKYSELMVLSGKQRKIPERVKKRSEELDDVPANAAPSTLQVEPKLPPAMIAAIEEENHMSAQELRLIPNGSVSWKGSVVGAAAYEDSIGNCSIYTYQGGVLGNVFSNAPCKFTGPPKLKSDRKAALPDVVYELEVYLPNRGAMVNHIVALYFDAEKNAFCSSSSLADWYLSKGKNSTPDLQDGTCEVGAG